MASLRDRGWGYGLILLLIPAALFVADDDPVCGIRRSFCLTRYAGSAISLFLAGVIGYSLTRRRNGSPIVGPLLLGGVAYLLAFPLYSIFITAVWRNPDQPLWVEFLSNWLGGLGGWSPEHLFGCVAGAIIYLSWRRRFSPLALGVDAKARSRIWVVLVTFMLVVFGALLGWARYVGIETEIQSLTALHAQHGHAPWLEGAARLRADLWRIVGWSSLPYIVVGLLLLLPVPKSVDSHRTAE